MATRKQIEAGVGHAFDSVETGRYGGSSTGTIIGIVEREPNFSSSFYYERGHKRPWYEVEVCWTSGRSEFVRASRIGNIYQIEDGTAEEIVTAREQKCQEQELAKADLVDQALALLGGVGFTEPHLRRAVSSDSLTIRLDVSDILSALGPAAKTA